MGSWTIMEHAPGVYRAYNEDGEILEVTVASGWSLMMLVSLIGMRNGWV